MNRHRAAALLALTAVVASTGCRSSESVEPPPAPAPAVERSAPAEKPTRVVTLGFAGDVHFQLHLAALLRHPRGALGPIARTLRAADVTMVNLESAITTGGTRELKEIEVPSDRYWFRTPPAALDLLDQAGVDVVTLANNHGADYGADGLADTLRAIRRSPIPGVGRSRSAALTPYQITVHDTDIAFFAADASPREGSSSVWEAGTRHPGIVSARGPRALGALAKAIRSTARDEVVVVYLHWGVARQSCPSGAQKRIARALTAAGADVIVGSHAHVAQGAGWLGDTYVAYGLGNFLWYHDHDPDTGVLRVRLQDGRAVSDDWTPAEIQLFGRPLPLRGKAHSEAVSRWRGLRGCAGLADRPASTSTSTSGTVSRAEDLPAYASSVQRIGPALRARMASTHGPRCPVPWSGPRHLRLSYVGFDGRRHTGGLVVAARYARDVVDVFERLYDARWPMRQMRPASHYGGDDDRSMAADNTSAYNCRQVAGSDSFSSHAYGAAVDINPVENPYLVNGSIRPPAGRSFARLDRAAAASVPAGVIRSHDVVVGAFAAIGWVWGGSWASPDYQHFSAPRR